MGAEQSMAGGGSMQDMMRMMAMEEQMAEQRRLAAMKPSERAKYQQTKMQAEIAEELQEVNAKIEGLKDKPIEHDVFLEDGKVIELQKCPSPVCPTHKIELDPSKIEMSPEAYVQMMMKADDLARQHLSIMLVANKLQLLHSQEKASEPLADMTELDAEWEQMQKEEAELEALRAQLDAEEEEERTEDEEEMSEEEDVSFTP